MSGKKHYEKGVRKELITVALAVSCLPKHAMQLLPGALATYQKKAREMEREGIFKEYQSVNKKGSSRIWVMYLDMNSEVHNACVASCGDAAVEAYERIISSDRYKIVCEAAPFADRWKILKNAETFMFFYGAGYQYLLGEYPDMMQDVRELPKIYYTTRQAKSIYGERLQADIDKKNVLNTTRINGVAVTEGGSYTVYNVGKYVSEYSQSGEMKALSYFNGVLAAKNKLQIGGSVLLAEKMMVYKKFVNPGTRKQQMNLAGIEAPYKHIYALTIDKTGQKMMQIMSKPNWRKKIYQNTLTSEQQNRKGSMIDCDGYDTEKDQYIFVFCVPDIKRLKMFIRRAEIDGNKNRYVVLCFDNQKEFVQSVVSDSVKLKTTKFDGFYNYIMGE